MESKTIAHFRNGIGNFIALTPALQALASMDESGMVDLCTDQAWFDSRKKPLLDIWERLPFIGHVYTVEEIKNKTYKTWFWTAWNSAGGSLELFKRKRPYDAGYWDMMNVHESDYYMNILNQFYGYKGEKPKQSIVPADDPKLPAGVNIVLTNGGFGEFASFKQWNYFGKLAREMKAFFKDAVRIIKIGIKNELIDVQDFDIDYVNQLTVTQTAKVLQQASLLITDDTGNMHIADALGTPMIIVWGGSIVQKNRPIYAPAKIIHLGLPCQPCQQTGGYTRCEKVECINDISVGEVMYNVRQFLTKGVFDGE